MTTTLVAGDLKVIDGGLRLADIRLADALGKKPVNLRRLIDRNRAELAGYGGIIGSPASGKRPIDAEYWLNEEQALLICVLARCERSPAVRRDLIELFTRQRVTLLRECRLIFGTQAAAKLWRQFGLPAVDDEPATKPAQRAKRAYVDQVGRFLAASTLRRPGAQVQSSVLYAAYKSWSSSTGAELVLSQKMFSLIVSDLGFAKRCSSVMFFAGLALVNHLAPVAGGAAHGRVG
ncbi:hypothetical protein ACTZWT_23135 [Rhodopseudomonas sp. NSM]|uniref:hypothetical protein n=1 Tax=Rhodopseudomonas sp. NSM TaxID=3457630 RepID=UPI0040373F99